MQAQHSDQNMCMHPNCTEVDLLPANCQHCRKLYCSKHIALSAHECDKHKSSVAPSCPVCGQVVPLKPGESPDRAVSRHIDGGCQSTQASSSANRQNFCSFGNCTRNEIVLILCDRCKQSFCLQHRLPAQHKCPISTPPPQKAISPTTAGKPKVQPTPTARPALKLSQMQMQNTKATAVGAEKVSDPERTVILRVFFPSNSTFKPMYFAFNNTMVTGRIMDQICQYADIRNDNHLAKNEEEKWHLFQLQSAMMLPLNMNLKDLGVPNNDAVMLCKGTTLPPHVTKELEDLTAEAQRSGKNCSVM